MSSDIEWEKWGRRDPYFSVLTAERFRAGRIDTAARAEFFASGQWHMDAVLRSCYTYFEPDFAPARVLDFGCGVGRLLIPFATIAREVVGVDVSPSMLAEARRNCDERGLTNVVLARSDDDLLLVQGEFDLVHCAITLQHIEIPRGRAIFHRLVERLAPQGVAAIQITYAKAYHPDSFGQPPVPIPEVSTVGRRWRLGGRADEGAGSEKAVSPAADPEMMMNPYNLSEIAFLMQSAGIARFHAEFTDHGGELGVFLYFRRPSVP